MHLIETMLFYDGIYKPLHGCGCQICVLIFKPAVQRQATFLLIVCQQRSYREVIFEIGIAFDGFPILNSIV